MKYYYPELKKTLKLNFVSEKVSLYKPWEFLEYYYLSNPKKEEDFLHIPSNTQLSEFLNKFNESLILPKLGKIKFNEIINNDGSITDIEEMIKDYGWNWINWNLSSSKKIIYELNSLKSGEIKNVKDLSHSTLKILGRLKLKDSIDYGLAVEKAINNFITKQIINKDYEWEIRYFVRLLEENEFIVIEHNQHIVHPDGILQGEIDYILMHKPTKTIYLADLKTSSIADKFDYWRQLGIYQKIFSSLNSHIKSRISTQVLIFHINNKKNKNKLYRKNLQEFPVDKLIDDSFKLKFEYLKELIKYD